MLERGLAKNGQRIGQAVLDVGLGVDPGLLDRGIAAPGLILSIYFNDLLALSKHFTSSIGAAHLSTGFFWRKVAWGAFVHNSFYSPPCIGRKSK